MWRKTAGIKECLKSCGVKEETVPYTLTTFIDQYFLLNLTQVKMDILF